MFVCGFLCASLETKKTKHSDILVQYARWLLLCAYLCSVLYYRHCKTPNDLCFVYPCYHEVLIIIVEHAAAG